MRLTLKALRINRGLTQQETAKILGISESTLNNYENYKSYPDIPIVEKILDLFNVSYNDVIFLPQNCNLIANNSEESEG
ncbi:MAG TPA: XRE family transcriptional regulator [Firmicutes bacterium]|nr:XRE family transcriptional regulator [Bacillota bacterium]